LIRAHCREDEMRVGIRKGLIHRDMFPVFCVCAGKDMCVRRLMEFVGNVSPSVNQTEKPKTCDGVEIAVPMPTVQPVFMYSKQVLNHILVKFPTSR
jgi:elongation factor G